MSRILARFTIVLLGYAAATLAASAFLNLLALGALGLAPEETPFVVAGPMFVSVPVVALFIGYFAFFPSVVAILLGEIIGRRDWLLHAIAGGCISAVVVWLFWYASMPQSEFDGLELELHLIFAVIGSGMVGGIAYWLVAGRSAGIWREDSISPGPSGS
ncbi:hypothetical protein [Pseudaminobacter sp. NGMCC 1.201702]|uniref:hypothetical protein n=1 Tax=Pseudaminobacter sp. NGMCC 1.201702 TaxID=3391825 RepID=UPI0039F11D91